MRLGNVTAGRKAKHNGMAFEAVFQNACDRIRATCTRIPDGCKQIGQNRLIRVKSPFDFVVTHLNRTAIIDTKTLDSKAFPHSAIDPHQSITLAKHQAAGAISGYVVYLRETSEVIFIPGALLKEKYGTRGSIGPETPGIVSLDKIEKMDIGKLFNTVV